MKNKIYIHNKEIHIFYINNKRIKKDKFNSIKFIEEDFFDNKSYSCHNIFLYIKNISKLSIIDITFIMFDLGVKKRNIILITEDNINEINDIIKNYFKKIITVENIKKYYKNHVSKRGN